MGRVKKGKELPNTIIPGQISIFDIDVTEINKLEHIISATPIGVNLSNQTIDNKIDNDKKSLKLSMHQEEFLSKNMILKNENLNRVIIYACGHMGIEISETYGTKTKTYDVAAQLTTEFDREINITALDTVYYSADKYLITDIQEQRLKEFKSNHRKCKVIHRNGDRNLIVIHENGVSSINQKGWVLDYVTIKDIEYKKEEVLEDDHEEEPKKVEYRIGDKIIVNMLTREVKGEVAHIYNNGESICFIYDNKYTATHISRIKKVA